VTHTAARGTAQRLVRWCRETPARASAGAVRWWLGSVRQIRSSSIAVRFQWLENHRRHARRMTRARRRSPTSFHCAPAPIHRRGRMRSPPCIARRLRDGRHRPLSRGPPPPSVSSSNTAVRWRPSAVAAHWRPSLCPYRAEVACYSFLYLFAFLFSWLTPATPPTLCRPRGPLSPPYPTSCAPRRFGAPARSSVSAQPPLYALPRRHTLADRRGGGRRGATTNSDGAAGSGGSGSVGWATTPGALLPVGADRRTTGSLATALAAAAACAVVAPSAKPRVGVGWGARRPRGRRAGRRRRCRPHRRDNGGPRWTARPGVRPSPSTSCTRRSGAPRGQIPSTELLC